MNVVIPMVGDSLDDSKIFQNGGLKYGKNFIEINHKPLFQRIFESLESLEADNFIFIVNKEDVMKFHINKSLKLLNPHAKCVVAEGQTQGAACSVLLASEFIDNDDELIINNGDQITEINLQGVTNIFREKNFDGGIITFKSVHPRWSYVRTDENNHVMETSEKDPISNHATTGFYYFKYGKYFVEGAKNMIRKNAAVNEKYYVCPAYNEMVLKQKIIGFHEIENEKYFPLTNLKEIQTYEEHIKKTERS